jgi:hypothetical protein
LNDANLILLSGVRAGNGEVSITPDFVISSVPEPSTVMLLTVGLVGLCMVVRTRRA